MFRFIDCILENILDQNDNYSPAAMMSAFNLSSEEGLESQIEKILSCMIAMGLIMYTRLMKNGSHSLVCICYIK